MRIENNPLGDAKPKKSEDQALQRNSGGHQQINPRLT
jgi:hypothetical protein